MDSLPVALRAVNAVSVHEVIDDVGDLHVVAKQLVQFIGHGSLKERFAGRDESGLPCRREIVERGRV